MSDHLDDLTQIVGVVFNPNPSREKVRYWMNGEKTQRTVSIARFVDLVYKEQRECLPSAMEALRTYSFYLWNIKTRSIVKLSPQATREDERDSVGQRLQDAFHGKTVEYYKKKVKEDDMIDFLNSLGFEAPSDMANSKMEVKISKAAVKSNGSFFQRIFQRKK